MSTGRIQHINHPCDKLGRTAHIILRYSCPDDGIENLVGFNCEQAFDCGVAKESSSDFRVFDWDKCPVNVGMMDLKDRRTPGSNT
jgi:hypothetical protein